MAGGTLPGCGFLEVVEMKHLRVLKTVERTGVKAWLVGDSARMIEIGRARATRIGQRVRQ